jgi:hypothetical protein
VGNGPCTNFSAKVSADHQSRAFKLLATPHSNQYFRPVGKGKIHAERLPELFENWWAERGQSGRHHILGLCNSQQPLLLLITPMMSLVVESVLMLNGRMMLLCRSLSD